MKEGVCIESVAAQVRELANWEDKKFFGNEFWRENCILTELYKDVLWPWQVPTRSDFGKARARVSGRVAGITSEPSQDISIAGESVSSKDVWGVNEFLLPEYFYLGSILFGGKVSLLLGKVCEQRRVKVGGKEFCEFVVGDELVSNFPFSAPAAVNAGLGLVVARRKTEEVLVWDKIKGLRLGGVEPCVAGVLFDGFSNFGLGEREIKKTDLQEMRGKVSVIAKDELEVFLAHEEAHILERQEIFPYDDYSRVLSCAQEHCDMRLESFVRALSDSFADTIDKGNIKGKFPYILGLGGVERDGLLGLCVVDVMLPASERELLKESSVNSPVLWYLSMLEEDLWHVAFPVYGGAGDVGVLEDACAGIYERSEGIVGKIIEADGCYEELKKVQLDFERERGLK